ncbi:phosphoribosyl-ATP diphosphatase [Lachnoclostridium phytofermentans ISDg]|uniref:Histidine biosynthesis bifunctional protein HisIE n=2 Tax=Lachnoclostridium phytofermentans TaxID=66219 RepID=A9KNX2_LACP7|nr:phosphoribosyl-ATP diphosphatase [Lachnoclostridium phytofermentans ISDg]
MYKVYLEERENFMYKKIIANINAENELEDSVIKRALAYEQNGADEIFIYNYSILEKEREEFLLTVKAIVKKVEIPVMIGYLAKRFEDIKKAFYTGASKVVLPYCKLTDISILKEGSDRFGKDKIILEFDASAEKNDGILQREELRKDILPLGIDAVLIKHVYMTESILEKIETAPFPVYIRDSLLRNDMETLIKTKNVLGVATDYYENKDIYKIKRLLKDTGIEMNSFRSNLPFSEFKLNEQGLIPVVTQDYKTKDVLMVAYMNEEAYEKTLETGRMTYYSRSRQSLWIKGETSGNYQYVRALTLDCDKDTILAMVQPQGPACHTGNTTCFFQELVKKEYEESNPLLVLQDVFQVILDRKKNPKEGSYTNYLFEKGIDKILKKCGEEATEIVIAAKNPNPEELKYEISDFLYHMMVLMAERGVDWDDIIGELSHRR